MKSGRFEKTPKRTGFLDYKLAMANYKTKEKCKL